MYKYGRGIHELFFSGAERSLPFIKVFKDSVVSPIRCEKLGKAIKLLEVDFEVREHEPSLPWIVGFFEAEGSCVISGQATVALEFAQKERKPLEKIQEVIGGKIRKGIRADYLCLSYSEIKDFIPHYIKFSLHTNKRNRVLGNLICVAEESKSWRTYLDEIGLGRRTEQDH